MYEVEYKVEITEDEREKSISLFEQENFTKKPEVLQNDYYIWAKESPYGGYDLKRYRDEGEKCFYTEKVWEDIDGTKARKEIEKEVAKDELEAEIKKSGVVMKIQKTRQPFLGEYLGKEIHIDIDSVKFDHSLNMRYFIEAEILCDTKESVPELKESMKNFLKESLRREVEEAKGMFTMAFKKL